MPTSHFKIGLRTIKTALAVSLCVLLFDVIKRGSPVIACLAAVFCMRTEPAMTFKYSKHRLYGTLAGGVVSMAGIIVQQLFPNHILIDSLIAFVGIVLIIVTCNSLKHPEGIVTACSTFLIIMFNTAYAETFAYALQRMVDAAIGAAFAISIDFALPGKPQQN